MDFLVLSVPKAILFYFYKNVLFIYISCYISIIILLLYIYVNIYLFIYYFFWFVPFQLC